MKLLLIDGNSIMNRGYFALPKELTNSRGVHTNALLGFLNIFYKIYDEEKPTHVAVAFDVHEPTFRHKMFADYKGTRKGMDDELREQFPIIKDLLHLMGIKTFERGGYEADDIIGTLSVEADKEGYQVTVLSGDRDLLQLATERVLIRIPKTKAGKTTVEDYYASGVKELYGVTPEEFIEMKGLMGDTSDNIPGVPGIGPKTAEKIISQYHSVEEAIAHIDEIKPDKARQNLSENRESAIMSRDLARIKLDCELDIKIADTEIGDIANAEYKAKLAELELNSILKRLGDSPAAPVKKAAAELQISESEDITEIVDKLASEKTVIGLYPVRINGFIRGGAVSAGNKVYITRTLDSDGWISLIDAFNEKAKKTALLSVKEYIDEFKLTPDKGVIDVSLAAYLIDPLTSNYDEPYISLKYLDTEIPSAKDVLGKTQITDFSYDDPEFRSFITKNAYTVSASCEDIFSELKNLNEQKLYSDIEYPLMFVLRSMEKDGVGIDREALVKYGEDISGRIDELSKKIYELAGEEFNINSPKQLGVILFEKLGLPSGKKNKNGYSTSVEVLEKLKPDHEIVAAILDYRALSKLKSTYVEGLLSCIADDGRIHSTFNQKVTATGRISSTEPNLQNIPTRTELGRELRRVFVPRQGYTYVDADYSQIELRVMASMAQDENLIAAFKEGKDIHASTASQVFGVPLEEVDSNLRRKAKAVNFGIIYGISSFGLGQDLDISRAEAKEYIEKYFATYMKVKEFLDKQVSDAKEKGYVKTIFNRIRPIPELKSSNFMQRSFGERVAMNSPVQGTAADIIKKAMIDVFEELKIRGLKSRLILQIHDELLIEAADDEVDEVTKLLGEKMMDAVTIAVPLVTDVHTGSSLYEAK